jgi:amidase
MWLRAAPLALFMIACAPLPQTVPGDRAFAVEEKSGAELQADLTAGRVTSAGLVAAYLARIMAIDRDGPTLRSVLAISTDAAGEARALDEERARGRVRGPLHGLPILIKDNIESAGPLPTTAGSLALEKNVTGRDAPVVARLRAAGAIILGKTNLSEWANFRSTHSTSGWSALGGLTRNPYALDRNACGSSSGSAVAVAASLAAMAIGTETDGSVTCPAAVNGLVGFKPTVGLVSRRHIVPISSMQDTAGPMTRTVADAAALLTVTAGTDPGDSATADADAHRTDYSAALSPRALAGARFGIMKFSMGYLPALDALFDAAVTELRAAGADVVSIDRFDGLERIRRTELQVLLTDFRIEIDAYLGASPAPIPVRTLREVIAFNTAQAARELPYFGQELFEEAERTAGTIATAHAVRRDANRRAAGPEGIDRLLATYKVDALIAPSTGPAWVTDLLNGDHISGGAMTLAAVAGYPHLTVPMGQVGGLPVGLSFVGPAWSDAKVLAFGFAYEQRTHARRPPALIAAPPLTVNPPSSRARPAP